MTIIISVVVFMTLVIIGILIGIPLHREATRRRRVRLDRRERDLRRRAALEDLYRG